MKKIFLLILIGLATAIQTAAIENSSLFIEEATIKDSGVIQLNQGLQYLNTAR